VFLVLDKNRTGKTCRSLNCTARHRGYDFQASAGTDSMRLTDEQVRIVRAG